ncbi:MAG: PilZ domain-containing protein [Pseudomonadota bacterium]
MSKQGPTAASREQDEQSYLDRRSSPRERTFRIANIAMKMRRHHVPCVIRDISEGGARIQTPHAKEVPDYFELLNGDQKLDTWCEVRWRKGDQIGVRFLDGPPTEFAGRGKSAEDLESVFPEQFIEPAPEPQGFS